MTSNILVNICSLIDEKGLKKRFIARKAGLSFQQFSDVLNGRRSLKVNEVPAIAKALGVTPNDLYGFVTKVPDK